MSSFRFSNKFNLSRKNVFTTVLKALLDLQESKGSSAKQITNYVTERLDAYAREDVGRRILEAIHEGVNKGILVERQGRFHINKIEQLPEDYPPLTHSHSALDLLGQSRNGNAGKTVTIRRKTQAYPLDIDCLKKGKRRIRTGNRVRHRRSSNTSSRRRIANYSIGPSRSLADYEFYDSNISELEDAGFLEARRRRRGKGRKRGRGRRRSRSRSRSRGRRRGRRGRSRGRGRMIDPEDSGEIIELRRRRRKGARKRSRRRRSRGRSRGRSRSDRIPDRDNNEFGSDDKDAQKGDNSKPEEDDENQISRLV